MLCAQVDLVLLPALTGDFGVMPGHVPTVAQLRPGVITVHKTMDKEIEKYFVSSGFAFVHADSSTDVCAVEAVKVEDLDPEAVRAGLQVRLVMPLCKEGTADLLQSNILHDSWHSPHELVVCMLTSSVRG